MKGPLIEAIVQHPKTIASRNRTTGRYSNMREGAESYIGALFQHSPARARTSGHYSNMREVQNRT